MLKGSFRPTLTQTFIFAFLSLLLLLVMLFFILIRGSSHSILESSERVRNEASREIVFRVTDYLNQAVRVSDALEESISRGAIQLQDPVSLEAGLYSILIANRDIEEVTLTYAKATGFDEDGQIVLADEGRGQMTVYRSTRGTLDTRLLKQDSRGFRCDLKRRGEKEGFRAGHYLPERENAADPTEHPTFTTPSSKSFGGRMLWSDLHFSPLEEDWPESKRHTRVSVQKSLSSKKGEFIGVLRVALSADQIDKITRIKLSENSQTDPHRIFLCDGKGRLITRLGTEDVFTEIEGDLRVKAQNLPEEIKTALQDPGLSQVTSEHPLHAGRFELKGQTYLTTFRALGDTQDWIAGIVVPESYYLGSLEKIRHETLFATFGVMIFILIAGYFLLKSVVGAQKQIVSETGKMNLFDFSPAGFKSPFSDVNASLESLEKAKSAMRALGKYAPIDLVRSLYQDKQEPRLGGDLLPVSLMFTDIADFTTISENLEPNVLAQALGRYLEAMVGVIQGQTHGTIDKFIGDAIMAIWNAPMRIKQDAVMACRAALECQARASKLFLTPEWHGLPVFETRIGLHRDRVMVGHFGAPERMNYTAIGDGVNLAARLEGLNKVYGTRIIASQSIRDEAHGDFEFRKLDVVAVKGKSNGVTVYELLGKKGSLSADEEQRMKKYDEAFELYLKRKFSEALETFLSLKLDTPSEAMVKRCEKYLKNPPPQDWIGVFSAEQK